MIVPKFFTEVNKIIQTYGLISLEYDKNNDWLIKPQNHLKLNVQYNIKKEMLIFGFENVLNPEKIQTVDSKAFQF